ncbi:mitochondrial glycoprotein [Mycena amicta]|nr:mitochondrial glycoprotein [Mycena amicta]
MSALCTIRVVSRTLRPAAARIARPAASRGFTTSPRVFEATPASKRLLQKLNDELNYEINNAQETGASGKPDFLAAFEQQGIWEIKDVPGNDEVFLTRKFGDEIIRVMFSIADLQSFEEDEIDDPELNDQGEAKDPPIELRVSVSITKPSSPAALSVDMYCAEGTLQPATTTFFKSSKIGTELTMESDFARRTLYSGPLFETLDVTLQENFQAFLKERGVDQSLAEFIPAYAQHKEQEEYVEWLENVSKFVES